MPHFESMAVSDVRRRLHQRPAAQAMIVLLCNRFSRPRRTRQHAHEGVHPFGVELVCRWELPEKRTGETTESENPAREEIPQRGVAVSQLEIVRDEAATLDCEDEIAVGDVRRPALEN